MYNRGRDLNDIFVKVFFYLNKKLLSPKKKKKKKEKKKKKKEEALVHTFVCMFPFFFFFFFDLLLTYNLSKYDIQWLVTYNAEWSCLCGSLISQSPPLSGQRNLSRFLDT
jgi:hypothetical protein